MDIYRLITFSRVFELKSFSKAAQELHLSQPTVSAHIANIEYELGVALFDRVGREILPTKAGEILYDYALNITSLLNQATNEIHLLLGNVAGALYIGGSTIPGQYFLPDILHKYNLTYKNVNIHLRIHDSSYIQEEVLSGKLDIGVVGSREEHPDLLFESVLADELVVLAPNSLNIDNTSELDYVDLRSIPWIIREKGSGTRKAMESGLARLNLCVNDLNVIATVYSTEAVLQCIRAGMGISVTSYMAAKRFVETKECIFLKSTWMRFERSFYMVTHRQRQIFPASMKFMETLRNYCRNIQYKII